MSDHDPTPRADADADADVGELYERFAAATFGFFLRRTGDASLAADLNQDLYIRVGRSLERFERRCSWRTWVFLLARSTLADFRASRWGRLADRTVTVDPDVLARELKLDVDPDREATETLLRRRLAICLRRLSDVARAVVLGHYFQGVTLRELTERLGLDNPSGSRSVLLAAQRQLRRCIGEPEGAR